MNIVFLSFWYSLLVVPISEFVCSSFDIKNIDIIFWKNSLLSMLFLKPPYLKAIEIFQLFSIVICTNISDIHNSIINAKENVMNRIGIVYLKSIYICYICLYMQYRCNDTYVYSALNSYSIVLNVNKYFLNVNRFFYTDWLYINTDI